MTPTPLPIRTARFLSRRRPTSRRAYTTKPSKEIQKPPTAPPSSGTSSPSLSSTSVSSPTPAPQSRLNRLLSRLPPRVSKHIQPILSAPLSHISAFLILHELTAVIPLFGLTGIFHYTGWLPSWFSEGKWVVMGVERLGGYARRKGWLEDESPAGNAHAMEGKTGHGTEREGFDGQKESSRSKAARRFAAGEKSVKLLMEFATSYAVVKALLVPRIIFSVWATPWFAGRVLRPFLRVFKRGKGKGNAGSQVK